MIFSHSLSDQLIFIGSAILILLVPGFAWVLSFNKDDRDPAERLADALGMSVAILALLAMLFFILKLKFLTTFLVVVFILLIGYILWRFFARKPGKGSSFVWVGLILLVLGGLVFFRFYQARNLIFPAWVDSVHHVLIIQKILDAGGLPATLSPELDVPFYYHYGFHLITALWLWASKAGLIGGVLWFGQVINALVAAGVYRFTKSLTESWRAALIAALFAGLALQMPAYYLTWGRYTLLTGLLVMLPAMAVSYELIFKSFNRERFWRLVLLTAGLALVHYLSLFYFGIYLIVLLSVRAFQALRKPQKQEIKADLSSSGKAVLAAAGGLLLASPWFVRMLILTRSAVSLRLVLPTEENANAWRYILFLLGPKHNYYFMGAALLIFLLMVIRKRVPPFLLWTFVLLLLSIPWGLQFGPFRPDHMAIILFIPAAFIIGYGWSRLFETKFRFMNQPVWQGLLVIGLLAALGWGTWNTKNIINPATVLADKADADALDWIEENTPQNARFFANTTHWQFGAYRGVNGGYWVLPLTGRFSTALPGLYSYGSPKDVNTWLDWMKQAEVIHACDDGFWRLIKSASLTHVYLREGKGALQPQAMTGCPDVHLIYNENGVWLYEINSGQ